MCTTWIGGIFAGIANYLWSVDAGYGTVDQITYLVRTTICLGVAIIGVLCHAYLISRMD